MKFLMNLTKEEYIEFLVVDMGWKAAAAERYVDLIF